MNKRRVAQTLELNKLYDMMWVYYNLFQPVMRLAEKTVVHREGQNRRVKRRFDRARTPFDRLCLTDALTPQRREQLESLQRQTNPRELRRHIYKQIDKVFSLPCAKPGSIQNVYDTLRHPPDLIRAPDELNLFMPLYQPAALDQFTT